MNDLPFDPAEEAAKQLGHIFQEGYGEAYEAAKGPPVLNDAGEEVQLFWLRGYLHEANNAIYAHMNVYAGPTEGHLGQVAVAGGNPGRWDLESSWYALQSICQELTEQTLALYAPIPTIKMPLAARLATRVMRDFLAVSKQMPLGKEGAATNHDAAKWATLLTAHLETITLLMRSYEPQKVYDQWKSRKFL